MPGFCFAVSIYHWNWEKKTHSTERQFWNTNVWRHNSTQYVNSKYIHLICISKRKLQLRSPHAQRKKHEIPNLCKKNSNAQYYNSVMIWYYVDLVPLVVAKHSPPAVHAHDTWMNAKGCSQAQGAVEVCSLRTTEKLRKVIYPLMFPEFFHQLGAQLYVWLHSSVRVVPPRYSRDFLLSPSVCDCHDLRLV